MLHVTFQMLHHVVTFENVTSCYNIALFQFLGNIITMLSTQLFNINEDLVYF